MSLANFNELKTLACVPVTSRFVYRSAHVVNALPFCLNTAQNKVTTAKMASNAPMGFFSFALALKYRLA